MKLPALALLLAAPSLAQSVNTFHTVSGDFSIELPGVITGVSYLGNTFFADSGTVFWSAPQTPPAQVTAEVGLWQSTRNGQSSLPVESQAIEATFSPGGQLTGSAPQLWALWLDTTNGAAPFIPSWDDGVEAFHWTFDPVGQASTPGFNNVWAFVTQTPSFLGVAEITWTPDPFPSTVLCQRPAAMDAFGNADHSFLRVSGLPAGEFAMIVQGDPNLPAAGQLCIGGPQRLLFTTTTVLPSGTQMFGVPAISGQASTYQCWYRTPGGGSDLSTAIQVDWQ